MMFPVYFVRDILVSKFLNSCKYGFFSSSFSLVIVSLAVVQSFRKREEGGSMGGGRCQ